MKLSKRLSAALSKARILPIEIKILGVFSLIWTLLFLVLPILNDELYRACIPFIGSLPALKYILILIVIGLTTFLHQPKAIKKISRRYTLAALLLILMLGVSDLWDTNANENMTPTDVYNPLRPFFQALIPAVWSVFIGLKVAFEKLS